MVYCYAAAAGVPSATGKRRVDLKLMGQKPGDPDNRLKSLLDSLVESKLLIDDSAQWCEIGKIEVVPRRYDKVTEITLTDLEG
jgi:Holliday junction resolvase RusA-like endonuclease